MGITSFFIYYLFSLEKHFNPHRTLDKQITDLILVLSRPDWIDLTNPRNQVVTRFIFECGGGEEEEAAGDERQQTQQQGKRQHEERYRKFFHQLLLSLELELRIQSRQHGDWAKEKLLMQIPPSIQWNLALARRWRQNVRVDAFGKTSDQSMSLSPGESIIRLVCDGEIKLTRVYWQSG